MRHADAYLPAKLAGFLADGGLDYLLDGASVVAVEWADRIRDMLPENTLWLTLAVTPERGRRLELRPGVAGTFAFLADLPKMWVGD